MVTESSGHHITDETSVDETYIDKTIMHRVTFQSNLKFKIRNTLHQLFLKLFYINNLVSQVGGATGLVHFLYVNL